MSINDLSKIGDEFQHPYLNNVYLMITGIAGKVGEETLFNIDCPVCNMKTCSQQLFAPHIDVNHGDIFGKGDVISSEPTDEPWFEATYNEIMEGKKTCSCSEGYRYRSVEQLVYAYYDACEYIKDHPDFYIEPLENGMHSIMVNSVQIEKEFTDEEVVEMFSPIVNSMQKMKYAVKPKNEVVSISVQMRRNTMKVDNHPWYMAKHRPDLVELEKQRSSKYQNL